MTTKEMVSILFMCLETWNSSLKQQKYHLWILYIYGITLNINGFWILLYIQLLFISVRRWVVRNYLTMSIERIFGEINYIKILIIRPQGRLIPILVITGLKSKSIWKFNKIECIMVHLKIMKIICPKSERIWNKI